MPATGRGEASGDEGVPYEGRAGRPEQAVVGALRGVAQLGGASRALALALARAGALGAAMRLAERCPCAHVAPGHEEEAGVAFIFVRGVLRAMRPHLTEVRMRRIALLSVELTRALQLFYLCLPAPARMLHASRQRFARLHRPLMTFGRRALWRLASCGPQRKTVCCGPHCELRGHCCSAHCSRGPVGGQPGGPAPAGARAAPRGLLELGVRPCGMRVLGTSRQERVQLAALTNKRAVPAQVPQPVRRDGGGPAAAAVLRLQHGALLLRGVPESRLARRAQGRVPAPASARLTGGCRGRQCMSLTGQAMWGKNTTDDRQGRLAKPRRSRPKSLFMQASLK